MQNRTMLIVGVALVVVGLAGVLVGGALINAERSPSTGGTSGGSSSGGSGSSGSGSSGGGAAVSVGERIFTTGVGSDGRNISRTGGFGMMASAGCANCHGLDGRGGRIGMMGGGIDVPDIRYSTLTGEQPPWTDDEIAAAIREGKDPAGGTLSQYMPRWNISDSDMKDLIAYLKQLG